MSLVFHVNTREKLTVWDQNQFFLVLLVIGSVATEFYVMVIMCLVDWHPGNTKLLAVHPFYTCCMSCLHKRLVEFLN